jgi:hypothetical protein
MCICDRQYVSLFSLTAHSTKRLIVEVIRFQQGKNLLEILETPATAEEARQLCRIVFV